MNINNEFSITREKYQEIIEKINSFERFNILVIGDLMIDEYIWGVVERISPEAPIPIVKVLKKEKRLGGAGNVALNLKKLGINTYICGVIGNDENGSFFLELCNKYNIKSYLSISNQRPTTIKTRVIAQKQHVLRIDEENSNTLTPIEKEDFINKLNQTLINNNINAIIIQDYDKGVLNKEIINYLISYSEKKGIPLVVDPKYRNFNFYNNVTIFKPNLREFLEGNNLKDIDDINSLITIAKEFRHKNNIKVLLITLSEKGILYVDDKKEIHLPSQIIEVADVSGAGDTVVSLATASFLANIKDIDMCFIANVGASIVCEKIGVVAIEKNELLKRISKYTK